MRVLQSVIRTETAKERKIISVSVKRQITIPQKYYEALGFDNEAECIMREGGLFIRPLRDTNGGEFSEQILSDLISQGYEGQKLLKKFKEYSSAIRPAIQDILDETESFIQSGEGRLTIDELFGSEE